MLNYAEVERDLLKRLSLVAINYINIIKNNQHLPLPLIYLVYSDGGGLKFNEYFEY